MGSNADDDFRIAIVGGGIGGLCAALQLDHHCKNDRIHIDVYEQAAQYAEIGAGVGLGVNAAKLLHHIGIGDQINAISGNRKGIWVSFRRYDDGGEIVTVPVDDSKAIRQSPVHRADFLDLLLKTVNERRAATLHTKKTCSKIEDKGQIVSITFEDGTTAEANLVIGCDGIHSKIRSQYISDDPKYSGRIAYRGLVDIKDIEAWWPFKSYSISWLGPGKHFFVFPISSNKTLNIVAFVSAPRESLGDLRESWTSKGYRDECAKDFENFDEIVKQIISLMPGRPSKWLLNDREPLSQWAFAGGKVVLMGDAAHAMLPHQGAGAGQAIEDGYIFARSLHDYLQSRHTTGSTELGSWTQLYQDVRLPRAQKAQATSRQAGDVYEMQSEDMNGLSYDECLPLVAERLADRMKWIWSEDIDAAYERTKGVMWDFGA
ncbi:hypothetical protein ACLMJK_003768 [Lecanora helva]